MFGRKKAGESQARSPQLFVIRQPKKEEECERTGGRKSELHITYIRMLQITGLPLAIVVFDVHKWHSIEITLRTRTMRIAFLSNLCISFLCWKMFF